MADNVAITAGSGVSIAADDISSVYYQRVKATWGPDGTANDTDVATGKPFPVQVRSATGLIPLGEPTDAKSTATDGTSTTLVSILKQISASVQSAVAFFSLSNITTSTTTTVKSGSGTLHGININTKGTIASTVVVYDNTAGSGTKIATLDSLNLAGWNQYDINFSTGLTLVTTGTVAPDITVSYR